MKYYCTKYWATRGILQFDGQVTKDVDSHWVTEWRKEPYGLFLQLDRDAFRTKNEAIEDVVQRAIRNTHSKKRALLKAQQLLQQAIEGSVTITKI